MFVLFFYMAGSLLEQTLFYSFYFIYLFLFLLKNIQKSVHQIIKYQYEQFQTTIIVEVAKGSVPLKVFVHNKVLAFNLVPLGQIT